MIVPQETISEIKTHRRGCVTVEGAPPAVGSTFWIRPTPKTPRPSCEVRVADSWPLSEGGHEVLLEIVKPDFNVPKKAEPSPLGLTRKQRNALMAGDLSPLVFDECPLVGKGDEIVLAKSRAYRIYDQDGNVAVVPSEKLLWIEFTADPARRSQGGWSLRFDRHDRRQPPRLLRRVIDPQAPEPDYTSDASQASDHLGALPTDWDDTRLASVAEARGFYHAIHEDEHRQSETRSVTFRLRRARARAKATGVDDSHEMAAIMQSIAELEFKLGGVA